MSLQIQHCGLYFGQDEIDGVAAQVDRNDDLRIAWNWLHARSGEVVHERKSAGDSPEPEQIIKTELTPQAQLIERGFRYRFAGDQSAGKSVVAQMSEDLFQDQSSLFATITQLLIACHAIEMVRPLIPDLDDWLSPLSESSSELLETDTQDNYLDHLWLSTFQIVTGIVLEDEPRILDGIQSVKQVIDQDIHPEGYFKPLASTATVKDVAYRDMVLACAALTLASEASAQIGENLWQYETRDVGLNTAITYLVYYYFYPDKWRWGEDDLTEDQTSAIFRDYGAWIEISTRRVNPRGVELLLEDQRPFFNPYTGGLTTLSHFKTERRKRFGLFG